MTLSDALSILATCLSVASFGGAVWRGWRDRPRLRFYVSRITFTNLPKLGEMEMVRVKISNVGYRPIVLTQFMALGEKSSFQMGVDDEPAATYGKDDQRFPTCLQPGDTLTIHPIAIAALERNNVKPESPTTFYDPYRYFVVIDSFERFHPIDMDDVRFHLRLVDRRVHPKWWQKLSRWAAKRRFMRRAKRRWQL